MRSSCDAPFATIGVKYTWIDIDGNFPGGDGTLSRGSGDWGLESIALFGPTPFPTATPTAVPIVVPTQPAFKAVNIYYGTYAVKSAQTPANGCFKLTATADGSPLYETPTTVSAEGLGDIRPPGEQYIKSYSFVGAVSKISLSVSATLGTGAGSFTLDNGDTGTITVTSVIHSSQP